MAKDNWQERLERLAVKKIEKINLPFRNYLVAGLIVNAVTILVVILIHSFLPPQLPLFYGMPEGEEQLASSWALTIPNGIALLLILLNSALAFFTKDEFIKKTLIFAALALTLFLTITTVKIAFLIGSF